MKPKYFLPYCVFSLGLMFAFGCASLSGTDGSTIDPEAIGNTAGGVAAAVTGNPALGAGIAAIVAGGLGWWLKKKKDAAK